MRAGKFPCARDCAPAAQQAVQRWRSARITRHSPSSLSSSTSSVCRSAASSQLSSRAAAAEHPDGDLGLREVVGGKFQAVDAHEQVHGRVQRKVAAQVVRQLALVGAASVGVFLGDERGDIGRVARLRRFFRARDARSRTCCSGDASLAQLASERDADDAEKLSTRSQFHTLTYCMEAPSYFNIRAALRGVVPLVTSRDGRSGPFGGVASQDEDSQRLD